MVQQFTYVVEHMEDSVSGWPEIEYKNITRNVGPENFWVTCVPQSLKNEWPESLIGPKVTTESIHELNVDQSRVLLLDPESTTPLTTQDGVDFDFLLFGDDPPKDRTGILRKMGFATRHLGPVQMTTDTAVLVSQLILEEAKSLETIEYLDRPEIKLGRREFVELPFRYIQKDGAPVLPQGLLVHLRKLNDEPLI